MALASAGSGLLLGTKASWDGSACTRRGVSEGSSLIISSVSLSAALASVVRHPGGPRRALRHPAWLQRALASALLPNDW